MTTRLLLALALAGAVALLAAPRWQPEKKEDKPKEGPAEGGIASPEKLKDLIAKLGYEDGLRVENGTVKFSVQLLEPSYKFDFLAEVSKDKDKSRLWIWTGLKNLPDKGNPPAHVLLRLLAENETDHRFFSIHAENGLIQLNSSLPNADVTAAKLLKEMDGFKERLRKTETLWNPAKWPAAPAAGADKGP